MLTGPPIDLPTRPRQPAREVWRVRHPDGRVHRCVLRTDTNVGGGVDVQLFVDGELITLQRCVTKRGADYLAKVFEQDALRGGWIEDAAADGLASPE
jgi:hypothetical protein